MAMITPPSTIAVRIAKKGMSMASRAERNKVLMDEPDVFSDCMISPINL